MKLETVKTVILIVLIVISLFLTFGMWNYQPNYSALNEERPEDDSLNGSEESIASLIEPTQIIFHQGVKDYGFSDPEQRTEFYQEIQRWSLSRFETAKTQDVTNRQYDFEMIFPTTLPMELLDSMFMMKSANLELPSWSFQRVYFTLEPEMEQILVEFVSIDGRDKANAVITGQRELEFVDSFIEEQDLQEFTVFKEGASKIYIPKGNITMPRQTRAVSFINPNHLVDILFSDPSIVRQSSSSSRGVTYFTDSSQMRVTQNGMLLEFANPVVDNNSNLLFEEDLLNLSISDINSYRGWTDEYNLMNIKVDQSEITYQMYYNGYPVFDDRLAVIEQRWGKRLVEYIRPLFRIDLFLNEISVELASSDEVIQYLKEHPNYNLENIKDIQIGYRLNYQGNDRYNIVFEPSWFINYNGVWMDIDPLDEDSSLQGGN
ncbi:YycH family regulatory protein [Oceanobacillus senegalensis]|uniref:YycH family regulatory protein n=1 Tax=Oceanobacillus senegalensis TaxID=1936063 RepID=UPI000A30E3FB|nr:two-component system activity regulator YycH [Oceanobacillus senegalensis]